jgi:predicted HicB family RNase H-like nuclease
MEYKGYVAVIQYDDRDNIFHGHLAGTYDDVFFEGSSIGQLERAFQQAVDDYLVYCEEAGREPSRAFSGQVRVRMDPELHRKAAVIADRKGVSLNRLITDALNQALED